MEIITALTVILVFLGDKNLVAQTPLKPGSGKWTAYNCKADFSGDSIHLINISGKTAFLWEKNVHFKNGIIELDIKGKDARGESFVGVAFHALNNETYDAIYFRPFNFRDAEKKDRAVQYVSLPEYDWDLLREQWPGKYEHAIVPDTNPNDWFHIKIIIHYPGIKVYVNGSLIPTLEVIQRNKREGDQFGLWIDGNDGWFKNVTITKE